MKTSVNRKQRPQTSGNHLFQNPIARYFRLNGLVLVLLVTAWNCTSESEVSQVSPAAYSVQINALQAGRSAHFIAETDRPGFWVVEATWEFGDGNGSQALSPSHVYSEP
ncbi:MAG: PKD domain-containing protein, partial [Acidobacteria bacterium]|nr:PKD domain-containing protein [Acidobacteriota bacterium]